MTIHSDSLKIKIFFPKYEMLLNLNQPQNSLVKGAKYCQVCTVKNQMVGQHVDFDLTYLLC